MTKHIIKHRLRVEQHFVVPIPHYPVPGGLEKASPLLIVVGSLSVLTTIELYHQLLA